MKLCGAKAKSTGLPCRQPGSGHGGRCKYHGGNSRGGSLPGQTTTKARATWLKNLRIRQAMGLRQPGGKPRKDRGKVEKMIAKAKRQLEIALEMQAPAPLTPETAASVPALPAQGSAADLLSHAAHQGLQRLYEIVSTPVDWDDLKQVRLIGDMALGVSRLALRAAEGEFRARRDDALTRLLEEIQRERASLTK